MAGFWAGWCVALELDTRVLVVSIVLERIPGDFVDANCRGLPEKIRGKDG